MKFSRHDAACLWMGAIVGAATPASIASAQVDVAWVEPTVGVSIGVDSNDNVYTANYLYALGGDVTLTKRNANGVLIWEVTHDNAQSPFWERATWVAVDHADNILVSGTLMSGYSNPVAAASTITKYSPAGDILWRRVYESSFDGSSTRRCLVDDADNVYVLGRGSGPPGFVTKVKKFAPDGTALWSYFDATGIGAPILFKLTPDEQLLIVGRAPIGSINGYAKITLDGELVWSLPGVQSLTVGDCAGDDFGNTYVVHGEYVTSGGTVLRKLDPSGDELWQEVFPLTAYRVEVGSDNLPVACGLPNSASGGAAFVKADEDGSILWQNLDADGPSLGLLLHAQLLIDEHDSAYLAAGTLFEMAVCKVRSDGSSAWTALMSGGYANAMAFGHDGRSVFVVGGTTARLREEGHAADIDGDGVVDGTDLAVLLGHWGECTDCQADFNGDRMVDGNDLAILLGAWGPVQ